MKLKIILHKWLYPIVKDHVKIFQQKKLFYVVEIEKKKEKKKHFLSIFWKITQLNKYPPSWTESLCVQIVYEVEPQNYQMFY